MFIDSKTWNGLGAEEMAEVYSLIGSSIRKSSTKKVRPETRVNRLTGTVVMYRDHRGFGFIKQDQGRDLFFHIRDSTDPGLTHLAQGERVSYELGEKDGRQAAIKIALV
ncbi:Cold shock protein, CspA family [Paenibacillus uliginis N3/975]|uniref:Cold shock protein, CspA family n=1 Tax=Paenibacillus uliginis N3/975 TaxID=1313296 RepID=A0A1X7HR31_9BACL|nr:cold shock domain-containing protein [Paenibacillus uliginis]SMF91220.1 Cold shock protein, CspA family [Paenibacillus uliginis N3/975]